MFELRRGCMPAISIPRMHPGLITWHWPVGFPGFITWSKQGWWHGKLGVNGSGGRTPTLKVSNGIQAKTI
eukprot:1157817-Pelagomonas_calceolata.AAC.4